MSLYDLPSEILFSVAELVAFGYSHSSHSSSATTTITAISQCTPNHRSSTIPQASAGAVGERDRAVLRTLKACSATCRILHAVFRPLVWSQVDLSDIVGAGLARSTASATRQAGRGKGKESKSDEAHGKDEEGQPDDESSSRVLFLRALSTLHALLSASPELGSYIRQFTLYLPRDGLTDAPDEDDFELDEALDAEQELKESEALSQINRLFPFVAQHLTRLRTLSLVSYACRPNSLTRPSCTKLANGSFRKVPRGPFRVDWDTLPFGVREGVKSMLGSENLACLELRGVVVPPRMVLGAQSGFGYECGDASLSRMKDLTLVAHCPMDEERLSDIEASEPCFCPYPQSPAPLSPPASLTRSLPPPPPALTTLRLGYCDTAFLRYITKVYPSAFTSLKNVKLNVIERDLGLCQWFLGAPSQQASADVSPPASRLIAPGGPALESFDCTIRCNTAPSSFHSYALHALDFSGPACERLGTVNLRYLLLSEVTDGVRMAIGVNVGSALGSGERTGGRGVEEMHVVVDWAFSGDAILLEAFKEVDQIIEGAFSTVTRHSHSRHSSTSSVSSSGSPPRSPSWPTSRSSARRAKPNMKQFTMEATHWPCMDGENCAFRREVQGPPTPAPTAVSMLVSSSSLNLPLSIVSSASMSSPSASNGTASTSSPRRPTPLRTTSSPASSLHVHSHSRERKEDENEGSLDRFFPFLTGMREEEGFAFESRYKLEHRREVGVVGV
ncbi:hypothetical protein D9611_001219 [Ephemerocybe angulata]|uniref:Uncharacterized protein n=1 Tax=Ephemerocybe angulata TaxID=980116 RepID=A0A8H5CHK4_9AGAR|nr:hypothetical protein D9611_001219 [Tulosesus angulatus]